MMKLLKQMRLYCSMLCVFMLFTACQNQTTSNLPVKSGDNLTNDYEVLVCDFSDSIPGVNHKKEYSYWATPKYTDTGVAKEVKVTVNGQECSGTYQYSYYMAPNNHPLHRYKTDKKDTFVLNPEGVLVSYTGLERSTTPEKSILTKEECVLVARQFINQFIDVDGYQVDVTEKDDRGIYQITFTKMIGNISTTEYARVSIFDDGNIYLYTSSMLGKLPDSVSKTFSEELVKQSINNKLDTTYAEIREKGATVTYDTCNLRYTILEYGEPAIYCSINVECTVNGVRYSERILLLVRL